MLWYDLFRLCITMLGCKVFLLIQLYIILDKYSIKKIKVKFGACWLEKTSYSKIDVCPATSINDKKFCYKT